MTRTYLIKFKVETLNGAANMQVVKTLDHVITEKDATEIRTEITTNLTDGLIDVTGWIWESIALIDHD